MISDTRLVIITKEQKNMTSVIVVTYNNERTIARCLDAIIGQQTDEPFEVLVGDDCSHDATPRICQEYATRYPDLIRLYLRPRNLGLLDNYYSLVREARGHYIIDCGGDDEWLPIRISTCISIMRQHPNVVHVVTDAWNRCDSTGSVTQSHAARYPEGVIKGMDMTRDVLTHQRNQIFLGMMDHAAVYQIMRNYPEFFTGRNYLLEDKQVIALLGLMGDTYYTPTRTFYYTIDNPSSIMHTQQAMSRFRFYGNLLTLTHRLARVFKYSLWDMLPMYCFLLSLQWRQPLRWMSAKIFSH